MKKILVLDGHPFDESLTAALCAEYVERARAAGFEVKRLNIRDLKFDPNLRAGYTKIQELEPDLVESQKLLLWCDHLVFVAPMWWGGLPAITKGYFDRSWLPGFAFKYHKNDPFWDRLLKGRSAHLVITSDAPVFFNLLAYFNSPYTGLKKMIFAFCGFKPIKMTKIGGVKNMSAAQRKAWIQRLGEMGHRGL